MEAVSLSKENSTCEVYTNNCFNCILNTCVYLILFGGQRKCVSSSTKMLYVSETEIMSWDRCRDVEEFTIPEEIRERNLNNYSSEVSPAISKTNGKPTVVHVSITVTNFILSYVDNAETPLNIEARFWMEWSDERLAWERLMNRPTYLFKESVLFYTSNEIWWPKVQVDEDTTKTVNGDKRTMLYVDPSGNVAWRFSTHLLSKCQTNWRLWPFDIPTCTFTLSSAFLNFDDVVDLQPRSSKSTNMRDDLIIEHNLDISNSHWSVIHSKVSSTKMNASDSLPDVVVGNVEFSLTLQRSIEFKYIFLLHSSCVMLDNLFLLAPSGPNKWKMNRSLQNMISMFAFWFVWISQRYFEGVTPLYLMLFYLNLVWLILVFLVRLAILLFPVRIPFPPLQLLRWRKFVLTNNPVLTHQGIDAEEVENFDEDWILVGRFFERASFVLYLGLTTMIVS